jgi:hypothetical protein
MKSLNEAKLEAQVEQLTKELTEQAKDYAKRHQGYHDEINRLLDAIEKMQEWKDQLQRTTQTLTCVYCGQEYPPNTPTHGAQVLTEHIRICEKHPMRKLENALRDIRDSATQIFNAGNNDAVYNIITRVNEALK